jgi:hypothetical protein
MGTVQVLPALSGIGEDFIRGTIITTSRAIPEDCGLF